MSSADGNLNEKLGDIAAGAGLERVQIVAWRDLEHPEAGGSEIHAARIAERWAAAGIDVELVASRVPMAERRSLADGYAVLRPAGRYSVFPAAAARALGNRVVQRRDRRPDGTIEVWNGMPWLSPLWAGGARAVFLHHVHAGMWDMVLPPVLAKLGRLIEGRVAPPLYRTTPIITLSESSRRAIVESLRLPAHHVHVVEPGVDDSFSPGGQRSPQPLVVAVGRLVPHKRFDLVIDALARVKSRVPGLNAVIAGEGWERPKLEALVRLHRAGEWLGMPGRLDADGLVDLYRQAWVLVSMSEYEGWGLTISEAGACATPGIASAIAGHVDAVDHGSSGLIVGSSAELERALEAVLTDGALRRRLRTGALTRSQRLSWDRTALGALQVLSGDAERRRGRRARRH